MDSAKATARFAGVLYLMVAITGAFSLLYVPAAFIVPGDAAATARRIADAESVYRVGILSELVCQILTVFLALSLYRLLRDVDNNYAVSLLVLTSVYVPVRCVNLLNQIAPLVLSSGADFLSAFAKPQLDALALGSLRLRGSWFGVVSAFWGLWFFPLGILVIKSDLFPKLLGFLLLVAGFAYLTNSFASVAMPGYKNVVNRVTLRGDKDASAGNAAPRIGFWPCRMAPPSPAHYVRTLQRASGDSVMRSIPAVIAALAVCATVAFGQSASDIESRYGKPDSVYSLSEHVWMTPTYDAEGRVCLMRLYPKRVSPNTNYLQDSLAMDEVLRIIDELIPVSTRGERKDSFGLTTTGGGAAWTQFGYRHVTFTFISAFRPDRIPGQEFGKPFTFEFDVDEKSLAEARRREALRPDSELMRERTGRPKVLEIRWEDRKCVAP